MFICLYVTTQARSHNYLYINYRGHLEMLQTTGNQLTKVRMRRSYPVSDKDFLTSIYNCVFYLLGSFTDNLCTCTVYVLKTQELKLHGN